MLIFLVASFFLSLLVLNSGFIPGTEWDSAPMHDRHAVQEADDYRIFVRAAQFYRAANPSVTGILDKSAIMTGPTAAPGWRHRTLPPTWSAMVDAQGKLLVCAPLKPKAAAYARSSGVDEGCPEP